MYSPPYNRVKERAQLLEFMRANSFVLLVTGAGGRLHGSHLPAQVREEQERIIVDMHMARANPQWREFSGEEVMVVFFGPHAYISPRWYEEKERVPTWNYAAVHAYGMPRIVRERSAKLASQRRLVEMLDPQWLASLDALPSPYVDKMLEGIVNFEIALTRLETRWKLSQNRSRREQELVAAELERSSDATAQALARLTRKHFVE